MLGRVFGVLGKDGFEALLSNELSALPSKVGGSTSCPAKVELRILPWISLRLGSVEFSPEYAVNVACVEGGESLPRTIGTGGQLLASEYSCPSPSMLLPEIGCAGWFAYGRSFSMADVSLTRASRWATAIAKRTRTPVRDIAAAA